MGPCIDSERSYPFWRHPKRHVPDAPSLPPTATAECHEGRTCLLPTSCSSFVRRSWASAPRSASTSPRRRAASSSGTPNTTTLRPPGRAVRRHGRGAGRVDALDLWLRVRGDVLADQCVVHLVPRHDRRRGDPDLLRVRADLLLGEAVEGVRRSGSGRQLRTPGFGIATRTGAGAGHPAFATPVPAARARGRRS